MGRLRVIPRFKRRAAAESNGAEHGSQSAAATEATPHGTGPGPLAPSAPDAQTSAGAAAAAAAPKPPAGAGARPSPGTAPAAAGASAAAPQATSKPLPAAEQPGEGHKRERPPGFRTRGRMRRRLQYLRTARELSYRDLGGLTFDLYRFGGRREELMAAKLERLMQIDTELRALERALERRLPFTTLREAGVIACPRCAEVHSEEDRFCPHCGMPVAADAERPLATAPSPPPMPAHAPHSAAGSSRSAAPAAPENPAVPAQAPQAPSAPQPAAGRQPTPAQRPSPGTQPTPSLQPATAPSPSAESAAPPAERRPGDMPSQSTGAGETTERLSAEETRILRSAAGAQQPPGEQTRIWPAQPRSAEQSDSESDLRG
ncbi:MAG TPA: hypothetical protein VKU89_07985 [Solirubrobacteraceae bacterium]|nr:hypothetical protein [Solirubrobacteraceae bacterium]